jgi:hypothetical protein
MTPVQYRERYLSIPVAGGGQSRTVRVEIYRIGEPDAAKGTLWSHLKEHFRVNKKKDPAYKLKLRVNNADESFSSETDLLRRVVNPYYGKGSPEDCQIALEVAVVLGLTTIDRVQDYANAHIGLDCNGFVGNYIWHVYQGHAWNTWPSDGDDDPGPSTNIASIWNWVKRKGREIKAVDEMIASRMYVLAMLDDRFKIIPGGPHSRSGHICITEPNRFMAQSFVFNTMGFLDLGLAKKGAYGHPAYWAVESTGPEMKVGLTETWYAIRPHKGTNERPVPGVFNVFRGSKGTSLKFRIAELR